MQTNEKVNSAKVENKNAQTDEQTLKNLFDKIKTKEISDRKESIYKDTEHLKDFDGGKSWRNKQRKKLESFSISFVSAVQSGNKEKQKDAADVFIMFYKETYLKNDFSVSSVYSGSKEHRKEYYTRFFTGLKLFLNIK